MLTRNLCLLSIIFMKRKLYDCCAGKDGSLDMDCGFGISHRMDIMYEGNLYFACSVALVTLGVMGLDVFRKS